MTSRAFCLSLKTPSGYLGLNIEFSTFNFKKIGVFFFPRVSGTSQ